MNNYPNEQLFKQKAQGLSKCIEKRGFLRHHEGMEKQSCNKLQESRQYLMQIKQLLQDSCLLGKEEMLNCLVDFGKKVDKVPKINFKQSNLVHGCQSLVYIDLKKTHDEVLFYSGYSDSLIINGFLFILFNSFNGLNCSQAQELWQDIRAFVKESGLPTTFTPNRRMGLSYIINFAQALQEKEC